MTDIDMDISDGDIQLPPQPQQPNYMLQELHNSVHDVARKSALLLNPLTIAAPAYKLDELINRPDLTTPLIIFLALVLCLIIYGKFNCVGLLYELAISSCVGIYSILQVGTEGGVSLISVVSSLGHCLIPLLALTIVSLIMNAEYPATVAFTAITTVWCTLAATRLLRAQGKVTGSVAFIVYPCTIIYSLLAIMMFF